MLLISIVKLLISLGLTFYQLQQGIKMVADFGMKNTEEPRDKIILTNIIKCLMTHFQIVGILYLLPIK